MSIAIPLCLFRVRIEDEFCGVAGIGCLLLLLLLLVGGRSKQAKQSTGLCGVNQGGALGRLQQASPWIRAGPGIYLQKEQDRYITYMYLPLSPSLSLSCHAASPIVIRAAALP